MSEWLKHLKEGTLVDVPKDALMHSAVAEVERQAERIAELKEALDLVANKSVTKEAKENLARQYLGKGGAG